MRRIIKVEVGSRQEIYNTLPSRSIKLEGGLDWKTLSEY